MVLLQQFLFSSSSSAPTLVVVQTVELVAGPSGADDGSSTNDPLSPTSVIDRPPSRTNYWCRGPTLRGGYDAQDQGGTNY